MEELLLKGMREIHIIRLESMNQIQYFLLARKLWVGVRRCMLFAAMRRKGPRLTPIGWLRVYRSYDRWGDPLVYDG